MTHDPRTGCIEQSRVFVCLVLDFLLAAEETLRVC